MHRGISLALITLLATALTSTNYRINSYDLGGGAGGGSSTNYQVNGEVGGSNGGSLSSSSYALPAGIKASTNVAVPQAPTLTDDNSAYDRLHLTLASSSNPSDTKYLVAISNDNFTTTSYVQLDHTVGSNAGVANYQTYTAWGGASGIYILGLNYNTTYKVKIAGLQGSGTGSAFGPNATASTSSPSITFGISTSLTSTPPFNITFASLPAGSVQTGDATLNLSLSTNALNGGGIVISDGNAGLKSNSAGYTISSATADLTAASSGYGTQITSVSQTSGGPLISLSPYNGSGNNVGSFTAAFQPLANFTSPITGGNLVAKLLAKSSTLAPPQTDYSDIINVSVAPIF